MPCKICGEDGHNAKTCPVGMEGDGDGADTSRRGQRESPRTPAQEAGKFDKLRDLAKKLSPSTGIPPLPLGGKCASPADGGDATLKETHIGFPAGANAGIDDTHGLAPRSLEGHGDAEFLRDPANKGTSGSGELTLDAIGQLLDKKFSPMNKSLKMMETQMSDLKLEVRSEISSVQTKVSKVEDQMKLNGIRMNDFETKLDKHTAQLAQTDPGVLKKIDEIETSIKTMLSKPPSDPVPGPSTQTVTAVVGGLGGLASFEEAETWVRKHLGEWGMSAPLRVYTKGDDSFKGIVFARFSSYAAMAAAADTISSKSLNVKGHKVWSKPERPIHVRAPISFLFRLKTLMVSWGYTRKSVYVDEDLGTMKICDVPILEASAKDGALNLHWILKDFGTWDQLQNNPDFLENIQKANSSLKASQEAKSKGIGKGSIQGLL